jgi:hypothetical protein
MGIGRKVSQCSTVQHRLNKRNMNPRRDNEIYEISSFNFSGFNFRVIIQYTNGLIILCFSILLHCVIQLRGGYYSVQVQLVHLVILYWKTLSLVHYMFRPNWPSSGVYYVRLLLGCNVVFTASNSVSCLCVVYL